MSNLQPAQFGGNPFHAVGGLLTSAGAGGWFRRRAELRHAYNMGLINQHFDSMKTKSDAEVKDQDAERNLKYRKKEIGAETGAAMARDRNAASVKAAGQIAVIKAQGAQERSSMRTRSKLQPLETPKPPSLWTP